MTAQARKTSRLHCARGFLPLAGESIKFLHSTQLTESSQCSVFSQDPIQAESKRKRKCKTGKIKAKRVQQSKMYLVRKGPLHFMVTCHKNAKYK